MLAKYKEFCHNHLATLPSPVKRLTPPKNESALGFIAYCSRLAKAITNHLHIKTNILGIIANKKSIPPSNNFQKLVLVFGSVATTHSLHQSCSVPAAIAQEL